VSSVRIYHNPRCSKSRQTLALLEERDISPEVILYLDTPPDVGELTQLLSQLGISARQLLRKGEDEYRANNLADESIDDQQVLAIMAANPKLIERPIVVKGDRAVLGRPPENVLELI
jgi:arsenate reductase